MRIQHKYNLTTSDIDRIVEMAWEDRTPFDAIKNQFGVSESDCIRLMREEMKKSSWVMWRKRVNGRKTKHKAAINTPIDRFRSANQKGS